jgi:ligand-binding sensor domain-containing protein
VFSLHTDARGRIWIGTNKGLAIYDGERFALHGPESGLNAETVFAIATEQGADGVEAAWVGGFGGVAWFPYGVDDEGND